MILSPLSPRATGVKMSGGPEHKSKGPPPNMQYQDNSNIPYPRRVVKSSDLSLAQRVLIYLAAQYGNRVFSLEATLLAQRFKVSRRSIYWALTALRRQGFLVLVELRRGRGRHSLYQLSQIPENIMQKKCVNKKDKNKNIYKTQTKDSSYQSRGRSKSKTQPTDYQGPRATHIVLILGARFYRQAMRQTRTSLESWELSESIRHALEGFIGLRIDGASLASARELVAKIWGFKCEIEALAQSGASPRRVCSFVAGRLAGRPDRARREVLRRTAELIRQTLDPELIARRLQGLKYFIAERETEFRAGQVCKRCGYRHTRIEYESGYRADGTGILSCFGWARIKLEELHETRKLAERRRQELCCRHCGGSLREGYIEGYCWNCWTSRHR
jgi:DNA-binding IscR family transcriptional regulator